MKKLLKIGTRGSRLAMVQTHMVADGLRAAHPGLEIEIVEILTSGDWTPAQGETRLSEAQGGKGLFAKEIERAILDGRVDCGVHSMKDMPSVLPEGLAIEHILPREDPRDVFITTDGRGLDDMPEGAVLGTSSLRRQAFVLARRPDLKAVPFRGNVQTRLDKLADGQVEATLLALSGLKRLQLDISKWKILEPEDMLPAAGQGAVGVEMRAGDADIKALLDVLHCRETGLRVAAEREALRILDGSCHTPIGAYAVLSGDGAMHLRVAVASTDGAQFYEREIRDRLVSGIEEAIALGAEIGHDLKQVIPPEILAA